MLLSLILVVIAAKLIQLGVTRDGVGPFEYATLAAVIGLLLFTAFRLSRRALWRT
ncbi:MAG: hypothetical protein M3312_10455 [Actinomycetota bacterium]|nr:hypothetical protein [Actinomycetota bacterium]